MISTELHFISIPCRGRVAISSRPRGGDWLESELFAWKASGIDVVVSLLESTEQSELGLMDEPEMAGRYKLDFIPFPIPDRGIPASVSGFAVLIDRLRHYVEAGKSVTIHCRQGVGRAGMVAASLLVSLNIEAHMAIDSVTAARGVPVPETKEQLEWIESFSHRFVSK